MKGAECAELNGKKNSPIFIFRVIENWGDNVTKMTITRKRKIREF